LLETVKTDIGLPVLMEECSTGEGRQQRNFYRRKSFGTVYLTCWSVGRTQLATISLAAGI